jgi:hypothetical protein
VSRYQEVSNARLGQLGASTSYFNEDAADPVIANVLFAILHRPSSLTSEKKLT